MSAARAFDKRYASLCARYEAGRDISEHEARGLRELWEAAMLEHDRTPPQGYAVGDFGVFRPTAPPSWEEVERSLGLDVPALADVEPPAPESPEPLGTDPANQDDEGTRPLSALTPVERQRLRRAIARHVDTGGEPTLRDIEREHRVSWRTVRDARDREVARRNH